MNILKFGGTSVSSEVSLQNIIKILTKYDLDNESLIIVVSALKDVTNNLSMLIELVSKHDTSYIEQFRKIIEYHLQFINSIFPKNKQILLKSIFQPLEGELESYLSKLFQQDIIYNKDRDKVLGFGEIFAAQIVKIFLETNGHQFNYLDSRKLIITDNNYGNAKVNWVLTDKKINNLFKKSKKKYVVTGYIGATIQGDTTTLGRGGSDYTASIFGAVLGAKSVVKWTDVNGIMTADPNNVPESYSISKITFNELLSLSKFGTNVLVHPDSINQLSKRNIPFLIRNTFNFEFPGTLVSNQSNHSQKVFSFHKSCTIVGLKKGWIISRRLLKEIISKNYLFFRLKSDVFQDKDKSYYVISNECLNFFTSEAYKLNDDFGSFNNLSDVEIIYRNISLVTITNQKMNKIIELNKINILLGEEGFNLLMSRIFYNAVCFIFNNTDSTKALNFLHEKLVEYKKVEAI